tara:strand:+ start:1832 stop:1999 length:168 start_codon:yes stop_codon:yes gene_type:complete
MFPCHKCDKKLVWQSDYDYQDFGIEDRLGIVGMYECEPCGVWVEIYEDIIDGKQK